jgi:hypothetical protein
MNDRVDDEDVLRNELSKLEREREENERIFDRVIREEEEKESEAHEEYLQLERMREGCTPEDRTIIRLIDERQGMLQSMQQGRVEFFEEFIADLKKKNRQSDLDEEDILHQINRLQEDEEA